MPGTIIRVMFADGTSYDMPIGDGMPPDAAGEAVAQVITKHRNGDL